MPTSKYFAQVPPFPSDVHIVPLPKVSLQNLENQSVEESQLLFEACQNWGFFLLDLQQSEMGEELLGVAEKMFDLTTETFNLDQSVLDSYAYKPPHDLTGYKSKGQLKTDDGKMDRMDLYSISQDDILGNRPPRKNADSIEAKRAELGQFMRTSHSVIILSRLDHQLGLEPGTLGALSPLDQISETSVRLLLGKSQSTPEYDSITLGGHTDIGTITLLFNVVGGLQILPAGKENIRENWLYIKPEPGHALVNIGDTLLEWTGADRPPKCGVLGARIQQRLHAEIEGGIIPPVENEDEETRSVNEWAAWRTKQIILGQLKPQTRGGKSMGKV
ncbi:oxidoreductase 2OG-Fe(II) oxygenase family [Penicillium longicatenatum]|nr:oxidoreductase 2OG-Fe(II) oxygenase family [Penicillium longicatenatum]